MNPRYALAFALSAGLMQFVAPAEEIAGAKETRILVIGDSTVCDFPQDSPNRGWGQMLQPYFKKNVRVLNHAKSGRSSKSFITEGLWDKARETKPHFVLVQFGHNDSHKKTEPKATDAATDFKDYLRRYIDDSRNLGAVPVFVTPMHRRTFGSDGKLTDILKPYADAMKEVAAEKQVGVVDLHAMSGELFQKLGEAGSAELANKPGDRTHFSEKGAKAMAELVMKQLAQAEPKLKPLLEN